MLLTTIAVEAAALSATLVHFERKKIRGAWGKLIVGSGARVVADTSAILACLADKVDFFDALRGAHEGRIELLVPAVVVEELKVLAKRRGRRGGLAKLALSLLTKEHGGVTVRIIPGAAEKTDDALLRLASELDAFLLTADVELRKAAEARGLKTLAYIRSKRRFG